MPPLNTIYFLFVQFKTLQFRQTDHNLTQQLSIQDPYNTRITTKKSR